MDGSISLTLAIRPGQFRTQDFKIKKIKAQVKLVFLKYWDKNCVLLIFLGSNKPKYPRQTSQHWTGFPVGYTESWFSVGYIKEANSQ